MSTTRSYDAQGHLLGSCQAEHYLFAGGAVCTGSSNPKDQLVVVPKDHVVLRPDLEPAVSPAIAAPAK